jgi:hypothetical protein
MTTLNNVINAATLDNISDTNKFSDRKIGKLSLELPTPVGVLKLDLQDYSCKSNSKEVLAAPPENVVVAAETNELDVKLQQVGLGGADQMVKGMTALILGLHQADAARADTRHAQSMELELMRQKHELELLMLKDKIEADRHARIQESLKNKHS